MRPLVLRMQAFGPYAGHEEVDFRRALDAGLFGIYGATGSGKSSIFSAITFALFGEAAKDEQPARSLRSDHAPADLMTRVELVFELGEKRYRVVRQPDQTRPAKRGGGETEEKHKAWLFDVTGLDADTLGDDNPGKPVAETKVSVVDKAIVDLLGYEAAQFRQIVLLPQGRFETFLIAKTEDRVAILRDLFDVSLYQALSEKLKIRARDVRNEISERRSVAARRLAAEGFESIEKMAEAIADVERAGAELAAAKAAAETALKKADAAYQKAAQDDRHFAEHADAQKERDAIEARADAIAADSARLQLARAASALAAVAAAVQEARGAAQRAVTDRDRAAAFHQQMQQRAQDAARRLQARVDEMPAIEAERDAVRRLAGYGEALANAERQQQACRGAEQATAESESAFAGAEKVQGACVERRRQLEAEREAARASQVQRGALTLELREAQARLRTAQDFEKAQLALDLAREQHAHAVADNDDAIAARDAADALFASIEAQLLESHALHLAAHLEPGRPCPVCGSAEHPAPASGTAADAELSFRYREAKAALEVARVEGARAAAGLAEAAAHLSQRQEAIGGLAPPDAPAAEIANAMQKIEGELAALPAERDIGELDALVASAETALADATAALAAARERRDEARIAASEARTRRDSALAIIPEELRDADRLAARIGAARTRIADFERAHAEAQQAKQKADGDLVAASTALGIAEAATTATAGRADEAEAALGAGLVGRGLTADTFAAAAADVARIDELDAQIRSFGEARAAARDRLLRAEQAIAATDRPDIAALKAARDAAALEQNRLLEETARTDARGAQLKRLDRELADEFQALDRLEKETGPLRDLAALMSGDNAARTTLETYAIATMFDTVLAAANLRLEPMTRGRFRLVRGGEVHGRTRRGLDILVEDSFTGRTRPTATLSGGETFIAALALALGLSDVVESTRGNVRLDAIFIDEGFGSLDSADDAGTLDSVLQALMDLVGRRRAVGLISHVPLVQQTVPNGFLVKATPGGSHIEERS